jgi:hypothetical protein
VKEAEWILESIVILNQNNKAVHAQTGFNRDVSEQRSGEKQRSNATDWRGGMAINSTRTQIGEAAWPSTAQVHSCSSQS